MKSFRVALYAAVAAFALFSLYSWLNAKFGVSFYRTVPVNNSPLNNPVVVASVSSNRLTLADGRCLDLDPMTPLRIAEEMTDFGGSVEVEPFGSDSAFVYIKQKRFICGTHAPRIVIPLIPVQYPAYERHMLGMATLSRAESK